jgi:tRNA(fMet)-specific endonuclease VapC
MAGKFLLDTNIVIALFSGEAHVSDLVRQSEVFVPNTVLGELYYGARKSSRPSENIDRIQTFARATEILNCDGVTAFVYSQIRWGLHVDGRPIPENDIWIAAIAIQHALTLATRDEHFNYIADLRKEHW